MKKTYKIDVDCANCANKMEEAAKNTAGVKDAIVNFMMLKMIMDFSRECRNALASGVKVEKLFALPVSEKIARAKYVPEDKFESYFKDTMGEIESSVSKVMSEEVSA